MRAFLRSLLHARVARVLTVVGVMLLAQGCATRSPTVAVPTAKIAAGVIWKIEEGDVIKTKVFSAPDLSTEVTVNGNGSAFFPAIGRIPVAGMTLDSLETLLNARYATQVVRNAAVQVSMQRELTLYGQVRNPGLYMADPAQSILALIARAGGQNSQTAQSTPALYLEAASGQRFALPREARLGAVDIHRGDGIFLEETSFLARNGNAIVATSLVVNLISAVLTIIAVSTR